MKQFVITYYLRPDAENVVIVIFAHDEAEAIAFAKDYRKEGFSVEEVKR